MPRTSYTPKNRFCFNSNLSEWGYLKLMYLWLRGETFTDIEAMLPLESHQFEWFMENLHKTSILDRPIERNEPVTLSRQSCHRVIEQFSEHYMADHIQTLRRKFGAFDDNLTSHPSAARYSAIRNLMGWLRRKSHLALANTIFKRELENLTPDKLNAQAWQLASNNIDHKTFQQQFEKSVQSPASIVEPLTLWLIQERYKRFRGYDREKMTPHTVNQMLTIQLAQRFYKRTKNKPSGSISDMSERDRENWRSNIAMEATTYVAWFLGKSPVGVRADQTPEEPET